MESTKVLINQKMLESILDQFDVIQNIDNLDGQYFHFEAKHKSTNSRGYGSDSNRDLAFLKSLHEASERYAFNNHKFLEKKRLSTSNGFAAHFKIEDAVDSAVSELIERSEFMQMWLKEISPYWLDANELENMIDKKIYDHVFALNQMGYQLKFGIISRCGPYLVGISALMFRNLSLGFSISTACNRNISKCIMKLYEDQRRVISLVLGRQKLNQPLFQNIQAHEVLKPIDHLEYYLNPKNAVGLNWLLETKGQIVSHELPLFEFEEVIGISLPWDHKIVKAASKEIQPLFFGLFDEQLINKNLFNDYKIKNLKIHPLA